MEVGVLGPVNIQPKSRNITKGTGGNGEGSTSGFLLPYEMQPKCFAIIEHSHCGVFFLLIDS